MNLLGAKLINYFHVIFKLFLVRFCNIHLASFCKKCGRQVRDFSVSDDIWEQVEPHIKYGHTLCYNCFCDIWYKKLGYRNTWELKILE